MTQSILVITLSNIGDAVMSTPVLERLHNLYPEAIIDLVADRRSSEIFRHCPYRGTIYHKDKKQGRRGVLVLLKQLRRMRYDLIVDLRTDGLAWLMRARRRLTKWGRRPYGPHAVQDLISIIHDINPDMRIPPTRVWLNHAEETAAGERLAELPGRRWLALAPGANWAPKIWASESFAETANRLSDTFDGVVILGGRDDTQRAAQTARQLTLPCLNLTDRTDLLTAAAVIARCELFIGNDSGLGHIASGVGTPTITVFGPGEPERYHPWSERSRWLVGPEQKLENLVPDAVVAVARDLLPS